MYRCCARTLTQQTVSLIQTIQKRRRRNNCFSSPICSIKSDLSLALLFSYFYPSPPDGIIGAKQRFSLVKRVGYYRGEKNNRFFFQKQCSLSHFFFPIIFEIYDALMRSMFQKETGFRWEMRHFSD